MSKLSDVMCVHPQRAAHPSCRVHPRGGPDVGGGVQGADPTVPDSRLQRIPEELASAHQTLRLQGGQHPPAGGRLALPKRSFIVGFSSSMGQDLKKGPRGPRVKSNVVSCVCFRALWLHSPACSRLPVSQRLPGWSGLQSV